MKSLKLITLALIATLSSHAFAVDIPGYPRNQTTLANQKSPKNFVHFEDAYISYKYVGGLVLIVTFSVPNLAYNKEFYLVTDAYANKSRKSSFARTLRELNYDNTKNTMWLGKSQDGRRDRFVMKIHNIHNPRGPYTLWAKLGGRNIPGQFLLK